MPYEFIALLMFSRMMLMPDYRSARIRRDRCSGSANRGRSLGHRWRGHSFLRSHETHEMVSVADVAHVHIHGLCTL
jgi:hypothetical protein